MATTARDGKPYIFVTWITGLLAGDRQCAYAPWFKAHFRYNKRPDATFNRAAWTADHALLVGARRAQLEVDGWEVTSETQNDLKLHGQTALLAGKPDLIGVQGDRVLVSDAKTGQPRHSDWWQVLVYLFALPHVRPTLKDKTLSGEVVYSDHLIPIQPEEYTPERAQQIATLLRRVGSATRPPTTPSPQECGFCDIADCADRVVANNVPAMTEAF